MFSGYDRFWFFPDALLLTYQGKKAAERSPGVGQATDMFVIDWNGFRQVPHMVQLLEQVYYKELNDARIGKWNEIVQRMAKDEKILKPPEETKKEEFQQQKPSTDEKEASSVPGESNPKTTPKETG